MPAHFLCFFSIYHFSPDDFFVSVGHRVVSLGILSYLYTGTNEAFGQISNKNTN